VQRHPTPFATLSVPAAQPGVFEANKDKRKSWDTWDEHNV
jgi:hypothetical protein